MSYVQSDLRPNSPKESLTKSIEISSENCDSYLACDTQKENNRGTGYIKKDKSLSYVMLEYKSLLFILAYTRSQIKVFNPVAVAKKKKKRKEKKKKTR